ncbi:MAG: hypothetical protein R3C69_01040 [Geminicoccaceae bacterium]
MPPLPPAGGAADTAGEADQGFALLHGLNDANRARAILPIARPATSSPAPVR